MAATRMSRSQRNLVANAAACPAARSLAYLRTSLGAAMLAMLPLCAMTVAPTPAQAQSRERVADLPAPSIRGFNVEEVARLAPGVELHFDLHGTPGGNATVRINGATRNVHLAETEPGQYVGTYTIGAHDRIASTGAVTAELRVGPHATSNVLGEPLVQSGAPGAAGRRGDSAPTPRTARYCTNCATVETVKVNGAPAGSAVGGSGSGASAYGEPGGARKGRYEVVVRYTDKNATQTLQYDNDPGFRVGDAVRVNNGVLSRDQ